MRAPLRGSRREIGFVAIALLLPIPLLAGSGLSLPLPESVERGVASLSPFAEGDVQVSGGRAASGVASAQVGSTKKKAAGQARVGVVRRGGTSSQDATAARPADQGRPSGAGDGSENGESSGGGSAPATDDAPENGPTTLGADESGDGSASGDKDDSLLRVTADGQGTSTGASADGSGNVAASPPEGPGLSTGPGMPGALDEPTTVTVDASPSNSGLPVP